SPAGRRKRHDRERDRRERRERAEEPRPETGSQPPGRDRPDARDEHREHERPEHVHEEGAERERVGLVREDDVDREAQPGADEAADEHREDGHDRSAYPRPPRAPSYDRAVTRTRRRWPWLVLGGVLVVVLGISAAIALPILLHENQGLSNQEEPVEEWP